MNEKNVVVGIDIGYSNLKVVYSVCSGTPQKMVKPVGVVPFAEVTRDANNDLPKGSIVVTIGSKALVACVPTTEMADTGGGRGLHADYPQTENYMALYLAALSHIGRPVIDALVTGLPVSEFKDPERKAHLIKLLTGEHKISSQVSVQVKKVEVIPQPFGGFVEANEQYASKNFREKEILVVDPGFYSLDWAFFSGGRFKRQWSHSNQSASSRIIEEVAGMIKLKHRKKVYPERIEDMIREGTPHIWSGDTQIPLKPLIDSACSVVANKAVDEIKKNLRESPGVDFIVLVGGGATFYHGALARCFPDASILTTSNSVLTNAMGFWRGAGR